MAPIQFGVLCIPFQLADVAGPVDVLNSASVSYVQLIEQTMPNPTGLAEHAIDIEFHYIGGETLDPVATTGNFRIAPTTTCADCPKLDYLLVGGPDPNFFLNVPKVFADFMRDRAGEVKAFFTTCTGGIVAAMVGLLDGKRATTNHQLLGWAQQLRPEVQWTKEQQWVVDDKFWTAGGACAGMDMFAYWVKENYGQDVAELGWTVLDYEPRDVHGKLVPLKTGLRTASN